MGRLSGGTFAALHQCWTGHASNSYALELPSGNHAAYLAARAQSLNPSLPLAD